MFYDKLLERYNIEQLEYCYNLNEPSNTSSTIKAHIPKLMPLIPTYDPDKTKPGKVAINDSIFVNDSQKCKISVPKLINTINYITISGYHNISLSHHDDGNNKIPRMTKLVCEIMSGNIRKIKLTDRL